MPANTSVQAGSSGHKQPMQVIEAPGGEPSARTIYPRDPEERYEVMQRRDFAARMLESEEKLRWYSAVRNESPFRTRLHFQKIVADIESEPPSRDRGEGGNDAAGDAESLEERVKRKPEGG